MRKLLKPFLPIPYAYLKSEEGKKALIFLLKSAAKQTSNSLDDEAVSYIEARLFPSTTTKLQ